jgi:hypothetical protein
MRSFKTASVLDAGLVRKGLVVKVVQPGLRTYELWRCTRNYSTYLLRAAYYEGYLT